MLSLRVEPKINREWRGLAVAGALACVLLVGCAPAQVDRAASAARPAASSSQSVWRDATYRLTCDGLVSGELRAKLVNGAAQVPVDVSQSPYYDHVDVRLEGTATGDVDGDGKPDTVVLLQCWPQPSNGFVEEVHVFRSDGSEIGVLPSPRTLPETTILALLYVPTGLSVQHEEIVASMKAYGPNDSHATGPSVPFTVRWRWNGTTFVRLP
jgi:hypothetical protein